MFALALACLSAPDQTRVGLGRGAANPRKPARSRGVAALALFVAAGCGRSAEKSGGDAAPSGALALPATPRPSAPKADRLVIMAGGDVNLGRGLGQRILRDPACDPFRSLAPLWSEADLRFTNLESQLSDQKGLTV